MFKKLSLWEKVGALGSIASIIGLALFFLPTHEKTENTQVGTVQGNLTINTQKQEPNLGLERQNITASSGAISAGHEASNNTIIYVPSEKMISDQ